jgi:hypothetical protein
MPTGIAATQNIISISSIVSAQSSNSRRSKDTHQDQHCKSNYQKCNHFVLQSITQHNHYMRIGSLCQAVSVRFSGSLGAVALTQQTWNFGGTVRAPGYMTVFVGMRINSTPRLVRLHMQYNACYSMQYISELTLLINSAQCFYDDQICLVNHFLDMP